MAVFYTAEEIDLAIEKLKRGEVIAAPAEGVYGYCADPLNPEALQELIDIKKRTADKVGFVVMVRHIEDVRLLVSELTTDMEKLMDKHWPGQVTLLLPAKEGLPEKLTGGSGKIAVRMPEPEYVQEYLRNWGAPLVSTSANITGQAPALHQKDLDPLVFALPTPQRLLGTVSRIIDAETGEQIR